MSKVIPLKLEEFIEIILESKHNAEEWQKIQKDFNEYAKNLSEEQLDYFAESGAGEILHMSCTARM